MKKGLMLILGMFLMMLPAIALGAYPSSQYPNVPSFHEKNANGVFQVSVQKDGVWKDAGQLSFDRYFRQRSLIVAVDTGSGHLKIRLKKEGGGMAHIDSVFLNARPPLSASGIDVDPKKLIKDDFDVMDASDRDIEIEFSAEEGKAILSLTARIEATVISKTPFQYPTTNLYQEIGPHSWFYTYTIEMEGSSIEQEIFKVYSRTGSGHPSGYTYGWVSHDRDHLYVTIDFTPDNTMDGDKDYATVYVKAGELLREFKVTAIEERWGKAHFTYTDKVSYEHKLYRFQIPFKEIGDVREIEMAFSAYGTASPPGGDFGRSSRQYLIAYERGSNIYGRFVGQDGVAVGSEFVICDATNYQWGPSVVYNSSANQYLVAWQDYRSGTNYDIYGQLINANGSLSGTNFLISGATNEQYSPLVAYNSSANQYLVVWQDYRSGTNYDIYGQLLNSNGTLSGSNFVICDATNNQYSSSVAYNSSTNQYLVAWADRRSGTNYDIYGQLINSNGGLSGANFVISDATNDQFNPSVAYNSSANQYLVAWTDYRSGTKSNIYGQLLNSNGTLSGSNFVICDATNDQYGPSVAYNSRANQYLVAWEDNRSVTISDIYGQFINANGSLSGVNFFIQNKAYAPRAIANAYCPNYLIGFWDNDAFGYSWTLYGEPCLPYNIIDFDGDRKNDISFYRSGTGVWWITPSSGASAYGYGWGGPGFKPVPGDYDGDGKTDIAIYDMTTGAWWVIPSGVTPAYGVGWGGSAFKPVHGDYDGDGKTDIAIYDTVGGAWWIIPSSGIPAYGVGWGGSAFKPVHGDYDGDGKTDIAIYDTVGGAWWIIPSSGASAYGVGWGGSSFTPVLGDYDGDRKTDIAIYHTANGGWWIIPSSGASAYGVGWGGTGFTPVPGDYDGDGKTDVAIYQTSNGGWWIIHSSDGSYYGMGWGGDASDVPLTINPD